MDRIAQNNYSFPGGLIPPGCPFDPQTNTCGGVDCFNLRECDVGGVDLYNGQAHFQYDVGGYVTPNANITDLTGAGADALARFNDSTGHPGHALDPRTVNVVYDPVVGWHAFSAPPADKNPPVAGLISSTSGIVVAPTGQGALAVGISPDGQRALIGANLVTVGELDVWMQKSIGTNRATSDQWCYAFHAMSGVDCPGDPFAPGGVISSQIFLDALRRYQLAVASHVGVGGTTSAAAATKGVRTSSRTTGVGVLGSTDCPMCQEAAARPWMVVAGIAFIFVLLEVMD